MTSASDRWLLGLCEDVVKAELPLCTHAAETGTPDPIELLHYIAAVQTLVEYIVTELDDA